MILTSERIEYYRQLERQAMAGSKEPWVWGHNHYHARITEVLDACLQSTSGDVIEIGCLHGAWSVLAVSVCEKYERRLLCIDPWDSTLWKGHAWDDAYLSFTKAMTPYIERGVCRVLRATSQSPQTVVMMHEWMPAFVFVDGSHHYIDVLTDLRNVLPITTGLVVADDWFSADVRAAVDVALKENPGWHVALNKFPDFGEVYLSR